MADLKEFIQAHIRVGEDQLTEMLVPFKPKVVKKGRFVLRQGQTASEYMFVQKGSLRIYAIAGNQEITGWIAFEGEFFTELSSLNTQTPSRFNIQAIEHSELLVVSRQEMEKLYASFPAWQELGRKVWENAFQRVVEGILAHQTMSAEERYLWALRHSQLVSRVPLKYLASYLGITPTSLSRLRKKIR
jgi:CRP-like cAMP-binding protein